MALFTIGSELALVNIGVAVRAACPYIGEHRLGMALRAGHALVHSAQREFRLGMIEFRDCPNRLPAFHRMTVLAGDIQIAVRATGVDIGLGGSGRIRPHWQKQKNGNHMNKYCRNQMPPRSSSDSTLLLS